MSMQGAVHGSVHGGGVVGGVGVINPYSRTSSSLFINNLK